LGSIGSVGWNWETVGDIFTIAVIIFVIIIIVYVIVAYLSGNMAMALAFGFAYGYEFVYCHHEPTNSTITYPEGTVCDDEQQHLGESEEWQKEGWTKLK
jgi:hypothetical protein